MSISRQSGKSEREGTEELRAGPAEAFSPQGYPRLMEIKLQAPVLRGLPELPLFTLSLSVIGLLFVVSGLHASIAKSPVPSAGLLVLALAIPTFVMERFVLWQMLKSRAKAMRPCVNELIRLRDALQTYMADLDKRTMRYFHCVTNSKVVTYFMLRQIENSLTELLVEFERLYQSLNQTNLFGIQERLRGNLEYRDGFVFNSGRLLHCPVAFLPARVHELVNELERGIGMIESEIEAFRDQVSGTKRDGRIAGPYFDESEDFTAPQSAATPEKEP
jgi:hypothetical protein